MKKKEEKTITREWVDAHVSEGQTTVEIPEGVTHIGKEAFESCIDLTQVTIPDGVTHIEEGAFAWCKGLTQLSIPNSVTYIGGNAFQFCVGLTQLSIPNSVIDMGESVFSGCIDLMELSIPSHLRLRKDSITMPFLPILRRGLVLTPLLPEGVFQWTKTTFDIVANREMTLTLYLCFQRINRGIDNKYRLPETHPDILNIILSHCVDVKSEPREAKYLEDPSILRP